MQKENKTVKRYRLHSLLKLHNRVMNDNLAKVVKKGIEALDTVAETSISIEDTLELFKEIMLTMVSCGKHNAEIIAHSQKLNATSSQEELGEFFKHVTGFEVFEYTKRETGKCKGNPSNKSFKVDTNMDKKDIETLIDVLTKLIKDKRV